MSKGIANWLLGIFFNLAAAPLLAGALLISGAVWGGVEVVWLIRIGIVLERIRSHRLLSALLPKATHSITSEHH